jgi:hypothetical protein
MVSVKTYIVPAPQSYVDTSGIVAADVMVVDRNGIGVKHSTQFNTGTSSQSIKAYQWYGVRPQTRPPGTYLIEISEVIGSTDRTYVFRVGPVPTAGWTYTLYFGSILAVYTAQAGDTATDVRDGLVAAVNAQTWGVSVTATAQSTNELEVVVDDTTTTLTNLVGKEKWKNGYYVTITGVNYIVLEQESTTSQPALPAVAASYNFTALNIMPSDIQTYLTEPLYITSFSESVAGTANINGVPIIGNVPANECVVYQFGQKIYFELPLLAGEIINVISK